MVVMGISKNCAKFAQLPKDPIFSTIPFDGQNPEPNNRLPIKMSAEVGANIMWKIQKSSSSSSSSSPSEQETRLLQTHPQL
jgi:hypothetical protein